MEFKIKTMKNINSKICYFLLLFTLLSSCKKEFSKEPDSIKSLIQTSQSLIRYKDEIFANTAIKVTKDVIYRNIYDYAPADSIKQTLKLNFYESENDIIIKRALIIFIHGGGFQGGSKDDNGNDSLCRSFAKHGFVVASLNYRLDPSLGPKYSAGTLTYKHQAKALYRATQDARFATRFLKKNAGVGKIDTNKMFIGGASAGGLTALHSIYLDDNEVDQGVINQTVMGKLNYGGFNLSSKVKAAFAIAGGLINVNYIQAGNTPAACTHSTGDNLIPIDYGLEAFNTMYVYGGRGVCNRLTQLGIFNSFKQYNDLIVPRPPIIGAYWTHGASINYDIQFFCDFIYSLL